MKTEITQTVEIEVPEPPAIFSSSMGDIGAKDLSREQIIAIGQDWTNNLLYRVGQSLAVAPREFDSVKPLSELKPLTLGELIEQLERAIRASEDDDGGFCTFDWGGAWPRNFCSYRGYYDRLSLEFTGDYSGHKRADDFLEMCKAQVGATYGGWKGGDYTFDEDSEIHVANSGMTSDTRVVGVGNLGYKDCCIITGRFDD